MEAPYTNNTEQVKHVGGKMIPPGETRMVNARYVPASKIPKPPEPDSNPLDELLAQSVSVITEQLSGLDDAELDALEVLEKAGKGRDSLVKNLAKERMRRADLAQLREDLEASLPEMTVEALQTRREAVAQHSELVALIDERIAEIETGEPPTQ